MQIYELKDKDGRVYAFEVPNAFISRSEVVRIFRRIPGAVIHRKPKLFSWSAEEEFCEVEVDGVRFRAWEPFGDSNRYWIGPEPVNWTPQIDVVKGAFAAHRPFWGPLRWLPIVAGLIWVLYSFFTHDCSLLARIAGASASACKPSGK